MFNLEFLAVIRNYELEVIISNMPQDIDLLEIGGGTGQQASLLSKRGIRVISIDIKDSNYKDSRIYPVKDYDGKTFPVSDRSVDVVFSSNVLEHITNLDSIHSETRRVLRDKGYALHLMPTHSWRFWTSIAHYIDLFQKIFKYFLNCIPNTTSPIDLIKKSMSEARMIRSAVIWGAFPPRHGARGNIWNESKYFHPRWWSEHFRANGFTIVKSEPVGLFYTGHMILGARLSLKHRKALANLLGSACQYYIIKPD